MTIDDYIEQRNAIQLKAENLGDAVGQRCWIELGVANRHIERVLDGHLKLTDGLESEIRKCFDRAHGYLHEAFVREAQSENRGGV